MELSELGFKDWEEIDFSTIEQDFPEVFTCQAPRTILIGTDAAYDAAHDLARVMTSFEGNWMVDLLEDEYENILGLRFRFTNENDAVQARLLISEKELFKHLM